LTCHSKRTNQKLIARETLPSPISVTQYAITVIKAKFGPSFGKKAKIVQEALTNLQESDQEAVKKMKDVLEAGGESFVVGNDGEKYTITKEMVTIALQTKKTSGMYLM
jgi:glycyl-tRNA synthetase